MKRRFRMVSGSSFRVSPSVNASGYSTPSTLSGPREGFAATSYVQEPRQSGLMAESVTQSFWCEPP